MLQKFKELYTKDVIPYLKDTFEYQNIHQIPKIEKIQINRGLGVSAQNTKILKKSVDEFRSITLRRDRMYSFLDRLINLALPRIRDFQGLDPKKFDKYGNYTFGILDQLIFPEIEYESVDKTLGFNVTIVTSAKNAKEGLALLTKMGLPFRK
jgi:large subunit ribosomal protein L5